MQKRPGKKMKEKKTLTQSQAASQTIRNRTKWLMALCGVVLFIPLFVTLYKIMITEHDFYESLAVENQTRSTSVSAARGTVYDRNMNVLAMSASVENVFLDPNQIMTTEQDVDLIARGLSELLGVSEDFVREQAADTTKRYKIIRRKIDTTLGDEVRAFINDNGIKGIYL